MRIITTITVALIVLCGISHQALAGGGYSCKVTIKVTSVKAQTNCKNKPCPQILTYTVESVASKQYKAALCQRQLKGKSYTLPFQATVSQQQALKANAILSATYSFHSLCSKPITNTLWTLKLPKKGHIFYQKRFDGTRKLRLKKKK